jgi:hypothetical protein
MGDLQGTVAELERCVPKEPVGWRVCMAKLDFKTLVKAQVLVVALLSGQASFGAQHDYQRPIWTKRPVIKSLI